MNYEPINFRKRLFEPLSPLSLWLKMSILLLVSVLIEARPTHPTWAVAMTLFAALVLIPIGYQLIMKMQHEFSLSVNALNGHLIAAILLSISFIFEKSIFAGCLAMPYLIWCLFVIINGFKFNFSLTYLTTLATFGFLTNAALWLVFDRFGYQPLEFTAWIVLLTGAHFHYAGFALTASLALLLIENPNNILAKCATIAVLLGVVLMAIGITTTQLGYSHFLETIAGVWMSVSAVLTGIAYFQRSLIETSKARYFWRIGAICLFLGMILAFLYTLRNIILIPFLTIPMMQAIHGTLNALGFGTLMLFGWAVRNFFQNAASQINE
jgi:YndJ-like protein